MIIFVISLICLIIISLLLFYIKKYKSELNYVYLIDEQSTVIKRLKYRPGLTKRIPKKSESILVVDLGDSKIKEYVFKNINRKFDVSNLYMGFVIFKTRNGLYHIKYCTGGSTKNRIGFNDYQSFPPKKETISINGSGLFYGYYLNYCILPTTVMYNTKDIKLICYGGKKEFNK